MMQGFQALTPAGLGLLLALLLAACAAPALVSSWKAPDAVPFELNGEKVAAVVIATDEAIRRAGEDALARQLSLHGAHGIPMYVLLPEADPHDETKARAVAEQAGVVGVVVMRPARIEKELSSTPATYSGPMYGGFWGGYYGYGWGAPWGPGSGEIRTNTIVTVETLVFSLRKNELVWGGQSRTTNPKNVNGLIEDTAKQVVNELARLGLMAKS